MEPLFALKQPEFFMAWNPQGGFHKRHYSEILVHVDLIVLYFDSF